MSSVVATRSVKPPTPRCSFCQTPFRSPGTPPLLIIKVKAFFEVVPGIEGRNINPCSVGLVVCSPDLLTCSQLMRALSLSGSRLAKRRADRAGPPQPPNVVRNKGMRYIRSCERFSLRLVLLPPPQGSRRSKCHAPTHQIMHIQEIHTQ